MGRGSQRITAATPHQSDNDARRRELKKGAKGGHCANVTVTIDQVMAKLEANNWCCAVSGLPFWSCGQKFGPTIPSIDRIDPNGDYSDCNIRITLLGVNALRGCGSDADMRRIAAAICGINLTEHENCQVTQGVPLQEGRK